ncbi:hypothetical protein PLEOSDRAFT_1089678 [Pleurotus ostreatus PC15]|uniref:Uncharacterized protein n=1 Tax=Pleurotus ostreatus (strain PC15) TaxID=1137138 RepID=A0A067NJX6_PLEO1|nr:hypothetical protein PLEOSDRAFT_1089678 [Pleurotus ostreatus PC15]
MQVCNVTDGREVEVVAGMEMYMGWDGRNASGKWRMERYMGECEAMIRGYTICISLHAKSQGGIVDYRIFGVRCTDDVVNCEEERSECSPCLKNTCNDWVIV